eukprot:2865131-Prymnesium_polylepis.1
MRSPRSTAVLLFAGLTVCLTLLENAEAYTLTATEFRTSELPAGLTEQLPVHMSNKRASRALNSFQPDGRGRRRRRRL